MRSTFLATILCERFGDTLTSIHDEWSRDEIILAIAMGPVGPMGFPWEWELLG